MKNIKLIFAAIAMIFMISGCEDDGGDSKLSLTNGAAPDIQKVDGSDPSINLIAITDNEPINLSFTVDIGVGMENLESLDVVLFYIKGDDTVSKHVLETGLTTFPKTYSLTMDDLYGFFDSIADASDVSLSDRLIVSSIVHLKDGRAISMTNDDGSDNFGSNLANSSQYSPTQTYVIACPLDDASNFDGDYTVTVDEWEDYAVGETVPVVYNPEDGQYTFRIMSVNNPYIDNPDTSYMLVTIDPATATVTITDNEDFIYTDFATLSISGTGSVGTCTGDIDLLVNFGQYEGYKFVLTKQ